MSSRSSLADALRRRGETMLASVPDGMTGKAVADLVAAAGADLVTFVARDGRRLAEVERAIRFFAPTMVIVEFPAWDCLPYDRVSPHAGVVAQRMAALAQLTAKAKGPRILLTTVNALLQRVPPRGNVAGGSLAAAPGNDIGMDALTRWLEDNGFNRTATVRETGEYAVRGGILDLYAAGAADPVRLDFFGDTVESIRNFDTETQRTTGEVKRIELNPVSEMVLDADTIARFRQGYLAEFGTADRHDLLYQAVSEGRRYPGMEHWLPLFLGEMETLFDYVGSGAVVLDHLTSEVRGERLEQIADHYAARKAALEGGVGSGGAPYKPLPANRLYLAADELTKRLAERAVVRLSPFAEAGAKVIDGGGRAGRNFAAERSVETVNVFDEVIAHIRALAGEGKRVIVACFSAGSRDRTGQVLVDHGLTNLKNVPDWPGATSVHRDATAMAVLGIEAGFVTETLAVIGEQDILGDRLVRGTRKRRPVDFLTDATTLAEGDLVVHIDHGIGRFRGLKTIDAAGAPHDCLEILYADNNRVYLPVENIELLSRYGSEDTDVPLDKLGGVAWQNRKARMKQRLREMAGQLIKIAAARATRTAPVITPPEGAYDEFRARFPYEETEDQDAAIDSVFSDLSSGRPMDRLICGDVGFGKTEVALRAAFITAMEGKQVAVVVPTTLLSRQHSKTFRNRFAGLPIKIGQASRLVPAKELAAVKEGMADGTIDIVVGTHALLGKNIAFRDLGLLIVDEEQHFGVKHKERLKELKADVHVLTLTATPIPRTLQLALTGVRELSLITTAPIDRLAVRTFISPFDGLIVREALLRERYRGGQSFYVCPRISDLAEQQAFLAENVPEVKVAVAHGQMPPTQLEEIMGAFYDGAFDVLLSTTIVESGLDIPTANTLIVHRADMFGLAQLYQLRGRVGRSKQRAYALFTVPADKVLTETAERRLKVLQQLDTLGAGFQLASHDLDIRGAGNLLGEEQSGHIKEVGYELYQQMLEEAVAEMKGEQATDDLAWSPQITIGTSIMIPETYVPDLQLRLNLYKRLADLEDPAAVRAFAAEMIDRFGPLPDEVEHLMQIVTIKALSRRANVAKVDAGPKGAVITFRNNIFANPPGLIRWISEQGHRARVRPDQTVVLMRDWDDPARRLKGTAEAIARLAALAGEGKRAAA